MSLTPNLLERCRRALETGPDLFSRPVELFPDVSCRSFWETAARAAGGAGCSRRWSEYPWPALTASLFRRFRIDGDRADFEKIHFERRRVLADRLIDHLFDPVSSPVGGLIDAVWTLCEESTWALSAHNAVAGVPAPDLCDIEEPVVDLFAGETAALLSWTLRLAGPSLDAGSPLAVRRVLREIRRRVVTPFLERTDFWWMGDNLAPGRRVNNWNPWIVSNLLTAAALLGEFDAERTGLVLKSCRLLDRFLAEYGDDGGCDEGASYWTRAGAALYDALEILHRMSGGRLSIWDEPLIAEMGRYVRKMHIAGDFYVNFADGAATVPHIPGDLVRRWGERVGDRELETFGAGVARRQGRGPDTAEDVPESLFRRLHRITAPADGADRATADAPDSGAAVPEVLQSWLGDIQVMCARTTGRSGEGLFLAAKGGHNGENHNHNDVGSFLVYHAGRPVLIDVGVETYTAATFGPDRYSIWTMRSDFHNLPLIAGLGQMHGREFGAAQVSCRLERDFAELSLDIAGAYPPAAGIRFWRRVVRIDRRGRGQVTVTEDFSLASPAAITLVLITPWRPRTDEDGGMVLFDGPVENGTGDDGPAALPLRLPGGFSARVEDIKVADSRLRRTWPPVIHRLLLESTGFMDSGHLELTLG